MSRYTLAGIVFASLVFTPSAYAYLDPGTGSMILQAVVAGIFGSLFAIKMYWQKILGLFGRKRSAQDEGQ